MGILYLEMYTFLRNKIRSVRGKMNLPSRKKHEINYNKNKKIQSFSFTGFQSDDVSDLKYANARYYDAKTGRFCSEDLMRGTTMDPESQNLYTYCRNNPITHIDPNGKWTLTAKVGDGFDIHGIQGHTETIEFFPGVVDDDGTICE